MEYIKNYLLKHKKDVVIFIILIGIISSEILMFIYFTNKKIDVAVNNSNNLPLETETKTLNMYQVDIKGEVLKPGTYQVSSDKRVADVIKIAGGLTKSADTKANNLSAKVFDEMVIIIYSKQEVIDFTKTKEKEQQIIEGCNKTTNNIKNNNCLIDTKKDDSSSVTNKLISINQATLKELMTLPGIGEAKAKNIIEYRTTNGEFTNIEDIKNVTGIGDAIYDQIKSYITI